MALPRYPQGIRGLRPHRSFFSRAGAVSPALTLPVLVRLRGTAAAPPLLTAASIAC